MMDCVTYLRISRSDTKIINVSDTYSCDADTCSIENQRKVLADYIEKNNFKHMAEFMDEGYTGTNFNRPGFIRMLGWIDENNVKCIIVKDLSRLGRDYIETGRLLDYYFPMKNIRIISVMDGYDSNNADYHERKITVPLINLLNDSYARDISCKVRYSQSIKRKQGQYIGAFAVYGYKKAAQNKNRLIIDEEAADIVKKIFMMRIDGDSAEKISQVLNSQKVLSPYMYKKSKESKFKTSFAKGEISLWRPYAVRRIIKNQIYTGVLLQGMTKKINYKIDKRIAVPKEEWDVCEGVVPAIISHEQFEIANKLGCNNKNALHRGLPRG